MTKPLAAALALAGSAHAQIDPSRFGLELVPVWRQYSDNGDGTLTAADLPGTGVIADTRLPGASRLFRLEIRYRITVSSSTTGSYTAGGSTFSSGGLASTSVNIRLSRASAGLGLSPGPLGSSGTNTNSGYVNPDPNIDPGAGFGIYGPFRAGIIPTDNTFGGNNGTPVGTVIENILPLATSAPNQRSGDTAASAARYWAVYSMDFFVPAGYGNTIPLDEVISVTLERGTSNGVPAPFLFYPRVNGVNATSPLEGTGPYTTGGGVTLTILGGIFPTPGTASAFALAGIVAARRRRR
jgi:hypothetical protein